MNRIDLVNALDIAAPALARTDIVPIMSHFWFTGESIMAYNDQIGVEVKVKIPFVGAVKGELLLNLLRNSRAKEVEFKKLDENVEVKAGGAKIKLGIMGQEIWDEIFAMPKAKAAATIDFGKAPGVAAFILAIDSVLRSVNKDTTIPDQMGITFMAEEGGVGLYATDGETVSYAFVKLKAKWPARVILPAIFCSHLSKTCSGADNLKLQVERNQVLASCDNVQIFGRVIESERPIDFAEVMDQVPEKSEKQQIVIKQKALKLILERACLISDDRAGRTKTQISIGDGGMDFFSSSKLGQVRDEMGIPDGHPDIKVLIDATYLKNGIDFYERMLFTRTCAILFKDDMLYMISISRK